jgi:predicted DNA-binding protein (MmcQ/YjbR family)
MNNERVQQFCMAMPHVTETLAWKHHLVYWTGDKAIGGKMFAMTDVDHSGTTVLCLVTHPDRFYDLVERDGITPAAYLAKHHWVAISRWSALSWAEMQQLLREAYEITLAKLPPRTHKVLALPAVERNKIIRERKKLLAEREAKAKTAKAAKKRLAERKE